MYLRYSEGGPWVLGRVQPLQNKACLRGVQLLQNKADNMGSTFTIFWPDFEFSLRRLRLIEDVVVPAPPADVPTLVA
jgi:hypothetical protein